MDFLLQTAAPRFYVIPFRSVDFYSNNVNELISMGETEIPMESVLVLLHRARFRKSS